jgi:uncharacterized membrane protein
MISAFAAAGSRATPRSFSLIIADDLSQKALSTFLGAFIFSLFSLIAVQSNFYEANGLLTVFVITVLVISRVVFIFVRWTDSIVRLGRVGTTIEQVEDAAKKALSRRKQSPRMGGQAVQEDVEEGISIFANSIGHLQMINMPSLQSFAESNKVRIMVLMLPGSFIFPNQPIACVHVDVDSTSEFEKQEIQDAFIIGTERTYDEDPCFGLIVLSEIASRALSPAVNDPGTGINVIGSMVRLFSMWLQPNEFDLREGPVYDRVSVPELKLEDMLNDAFSAIARDGAKNIEVGIWLQKGLSSLATIGNPSERTALKNAAQAAFKRAEKSLEFSEDLELLREVVAELEYENRG